MTNNENQPYFDTDLSRIKSGETSLHLMADWYRAKMNVLEPKHRATIDKIIIASIRYKRDVSAGFTLSDIKNAKQNTPYMRGLHVGMTAEETNDLESNVEHLVKHGILGVREENTSGQKEYFFVTPAFEKWFRASQYGVPENAADYLEEMRPISFFETPQNG